MSDGYEDLDLGEDPTPPAESAPPAGAARPRAVPPPPVSATPAPAGVKSAAPVLAGAAVLCLAFIAFGAFFARRHAGDSSAPGTATETATPSATAGAASNAEATSKAKATSNAEAASRTAASATSNADARKNPSSPPAKRSGASAEAGERGRNPTSIPASTPTSIPTSTATSVPTSTPTHMEGPASRTHGTSITDVPLPPPPTPIEDAPRYPGEGFRRPRLADADCIRSALRVPRDAVERLSGPVTVRFAVGRDGAVSRIEVLGGVSDRRVTDGIAAAVRACPFVPGADAQGEPTALGVTLPVRFAGQ
jgi:TonB family protein